MYVHVNPCELEPISHAKTLNDQCEFVQYSVLESIFVAQEPHKFCSGSVRAKQVSARPSVFDRPAPSPALRPTNPYLHPSKNTNTCDSPYNILNSLFWALSQSGKMWCVAFSPHKKTLVKSTYMRFPIQKVKFAFLGPFCLRGSNRKSSVTVTPESNHRRLYYTVQLYTAV